MTAVNSHLLATTPRHPRHCLPANNPPNANHDKMANNNLCSGTPPDIVAPLITVMVNKMNAHLMVAKHSASKVNNGGVRYSANRRCARSAYNKSNHRNNDNNTAAYANIAGIMCNHANNGGGGLCATIAIGNNIATVAKPNKMPRDNNLRVFHHPNTTAANINTDSQIPKSNRGNTA